MNGNFAADLLWSFHKLVQNWIVDRPTARNFTVLIFCLFFFMNIISIASFELHSFRHFYRKKNQIYHIIIIIIITIIIINITLSPTVKLVYMLEAMITSTEIVWHQLWFKRYVVAGLRVFHRITNKEFFWHQAECSQHDILSFWPYWEILDYYAVFLHVTQHGLRTPNEAFFHQNPKLLGLGR